MKKIIRFLIFVVAVFLIFRDAQVSANNRKVLGTAQARRQRMQNIKPFEINSGFVIYKGKYIKPPYVIKTQKGRIYINKVEIPYMPQGPFFRRNIRMRYFNQALLNQTINQIQENLQRNAMLICTNSGSIDYSPARQAVQILDVLLSDQTQDAKVQKLIQVGPPWIPSDQWALLVEKFKAPTELFEQVQALKQQHIQLSENGTDDELSMSFLSGITIAGFILAVWALGTLLSCRPPAINSGQEIGSSKVSSRQVIWLIVLVVVLNIYDLTCTLFAHGVGGLWELNPFAGSVIENAPMIVTFKISLTIGAAILLLLGRRLKLAQIGVWWISVLYTVLIIRWSIFNSIFL